MIPTGNTDKTAGADCPKCKAKCAEFRQMGGPMQWECLGCGAGGAIVVEKTTSTKPGPTVHKHWSDRTK